VYTSALEKNPSDSAIASKIGKALVTTHEYNKAIEYYENAVKNSNGNSSLRSDLAELYLKLKKLDEAERVLKGTLQEKGGNALRSLIEIYSKNQNLMCINPLVM
jgi:tetratricopeptide repeat protein 21B